MSQEATTVAGAKEESVCGCRGFEPSGDDSPKAGKPDVVAGQTRYRQVDLD